MREIEPFNFVSILLEMDKNVLQDIFGVELYSNSDLFKKYTYREAIEIYNVWKNIKK